MAGTVNYDRPKSTTVNATTLDVSLLAGEEPTALGALTGDNSGSTGILNVTFQVDADESGGVDIQDLFRIEDLKVTLDAATGRINLTGMVWPVKGDATDGVAVAINVVHPQTMDVWQTAAGRPRQV